MVIRAKNKDRGIIKKTEEDSTDNLPLPGDSEDSFVMVLFPVETWRKVQDMGERMDVSPAAVVSESIRLLDKRISDADHLSNRRIEE